MPADVIGLIILIACVVLFLIRCLPEPVVGLIGCILMVLLGVTDFKTAFSGFSNSIVLLMASSMIVGIAMFKTGTAQSIGRIVMRLARNNEKIFLMASCIVSGILAMFLANTAVLAADIPIVDGVCQSNGNMKRMNLLLPIACSVMIGGVSTLIGCTPQLTANALLISMSGMEMGMWDLTGPGLCLFAVFLIYTFFFGIKNRKQDMGRQKRRKNGHRRKSYQIGNLRRCG